MVSFGSARLRRFRFYYSLSFDLCLWGTLALVLDSTFKYEPFKMFLVMLGVVKSLVEWLV